MTTASERVRRWRLNHPDKAREALRKWRAANPDKVKEYNRRQYLRRRGDAKAKAAQS